MRLLAIPITEFDPADRPGRGGERLEARLGVEPSLGRPAGRSILPVFDERPPLFRERQLCGALMSA